MGRPERVKIVEVGPRDGLQNEAQRVSLETRIALVDRLANAGLPMIEAGSFVSPKWVPQMAESAEVFAGIQRLAGVTYSALTPNLKGFDAALRANVDEVAVFAAASEQFSQKNINCSISDSLARFQPVLSAAQAANLPVRGYVSCVLGCPYEGNIDPHAVLEVSEQLLTMGCYEVSLGDTIGVGTPGSVQALLDVLIPAIGPERLALHCHDTYGQALANICAGLEYGIATVDSAVAGLGGCPYARGASGNVATEDVLYMLNGLHIDTGVDLSALANVGQWICEQLGRSNQSRVGTALAVK